MMQTEQQQLAESRMKYAMSAAVIIHHHQTDI